MNRGVLLPRRAELGEGGWGRGFVECVSQECSGQTCLCQLLTLFSPSVWKPVGAEGPCALARTD